MQQHEMIDINALTPYENNARTHSPDQLEMIGNSIKEFGFINPVIIDENNMILVGHGRVMAAKNIGIKQVPFRRVTNLTEDQKKAYIIADNKLSDLGGWDDELLLAELESIELDMSQFGFEIEIDDIEDPDVVEDNIPERSEPRCKLGELWQLGDHRLICGDSTDVNVIDRLMDGVKADMVFCDAPYGYKYESNYQDKYEMLQNDDKILDFIPAIWGAMKDNCPVYEFCGWQSLKQWLEYFENTSLNLKNVIIWKKNNWSMGDLKGAYAGQYEVILYLNKGRVELNGARDTDIWEFDREPPKMHPTMKPIELIAYALNKSSKRNDIVIDCFGGSGSTLIACEQLNRKCFMCELDEHYCDVIIGRWENFTGRKAVRI